MRRSDAGVIYVRIEHRGRYSETVPIRLKYNYSYERGLITTILTGVLVTCLLLLLPVLTAWYYLIKVRLFFRRHFGKFDKGSSVFVCSSLYVCVCFFSLFVRAFVSACGFVCACLFVGLFVCASARLYVFLRECLRREY